MADVLHISDLTADPKNARKHSARNLGIVEDSLREVGFSRSIVIDEDRRILAGNGTIEAAGQIGMENVIVVPADGNTIVAVQRTGLTEAQKQRLALFDNRSSDTATWDVAILAELAREDAQILEGLFTPGEMDDLLESYSAGNVEEAAEDLSPLNVPDEYCCPKCGHAWSGKAK